MSSSPPVHEVQQSIQFLKTRLCPDWVEQFDHGDFAVNLLLHMRERQTPRLVFSPSKLSEIAALTRVHDPEEWSWEREIADEAVAGRMYGASNAYCRRFLAPDPATFDFTVFEDPDPQTIHGLNRHRWFLSLAQAYWLDGDRRYFDALMRHWDFFAAKVPSPDEAFLSRVHNLGVPAVLSPYHELDVSIRLRHWWWAYWLAVYAEPMTPERNAVLLTRCLGQFDARAARGVRVLEHNFTSMHMESLYLWAAALPEFTGMNLWRHLARTTLESSLVAAVYGDGVQWEKSAGYHIGCQRWYGMPYRMAQANGETWGESYGRRLRAMSEYTDAIVLPDGTTPTISDADRTDGWRHAQAFTHGLFPDLKFRRPVGPTHFSLWACDGHTWNPNTVVKAKPTLVAFPEGGAAVAHSSYGPGASYVLLDNGPNRAFHAHKNNLTLHYEAFGKPVIVDPGRAVYRGDADRSWVMACESHNTVCMEDTPLIAGAVVASRALQIIPSPGDPRVSTIATAAVEGCFRLVTHFGGYAADRHASVKRMVLMGRDEASPWLAAIDEIDGPSEHTWTHSWLVPSSEPVRVEAGEFRARLDNGLWLYLRMTGGGPLMPRDDAMFWCKGYGEKSPARWLRFSRCCATDRRITIAIPSRTENAPIDIPMRMIEAEIEAAMEGAEWKALW